MGLKESGLRASVRSVSTVVPAFFDVAITDTNSPVNEGDVLVVDYSVDNTSDSFETQDIRLEIESVQEDADLDVSLSGGASDSGTLEWDTTGQDADTYEATVLSDDDSDTVTVEIESTIPDSELLHAAYDFSKEDGTTPVVDRSDNNLDLDTGSYSGVNDDINGVQAGEFDGVDDTVFTTSGSMDFPYLVATVHRPDDTDGNHVPVMPSDSFVFHKIDAGDFFMRTTNSVRGSAATEGDAVIHLSVFDGDDSEIRIDGSVDASGSQDNVDYDGVGVGSRESGDSEFYDGAIGEVLLYDGIPDIGEVESYLSNKWGVSI